MGNVALLIAKSLVSLQCTDNVPHSDPVNGSFAFQHVQQAYLKMWPVCVFSVLACEASVCSDNSTGRMGTLKYFIFSCSTMSDIQEIITKSTSALFELYTALTQWSNQWRNQWSDSSTHSNSTKYFVKYMFSVNCLGFFKYLFRTPRQTRSKMNAVLSKWCLWRCCATFEPKSSINKTLLHWA